MNLTPKQLKILTLVRDWRVTRGYSPTMQELADMTGVSKVTVFEHVEALIKKGALIRDPNKARSLTLTTEARLPDEQRASRIPLVGKIAAGYPIEAIEDRQFLDLEDLFGPDSRFTRSGDIFALEVTGESMRDAGILEGDYVVCERRQTARNGETVVALIDGDEATLKKLYKEPNGRIRLQPANPAFEPIWPTSLQIQGVVIGIVRRYD